MSRKQTRRSTMIWRRQHRVKDTKAIVSSNKNDYDRSTNYVYDGVFDLSLEKSTTRQMVSFSLWSIVGRDDTGYR